MRKTMSIYLRYMDVDIPRVNRFGRLQFYVVTARYTYVATHYQEYPLVYSNTCEDM
jgi:hypothetical protein